jgi:hypothetical protein
MTSKPEKEKALFSKKIDRQYIRKMADDGYCAPHRKDLFAETGSCLTRKELGQVAETYNEFHEETPIPKEIFAKKDALHRELSKRFADACTEEGEYCWLQKMPRSSEAVKQNLQNFKPLMPSAWYADRRTWLNTYDILFVMKQYERYHQHFKFLGVLSRDFMNPYSSDSTSCVARHMCKLNVNRTLLRKGRTEFGIVLNHDKHYESGSHWVAVFGSFDPRSPQYGIFYYDSVAKPPKPEVLAYLEKMKRQFETRAPPPEEPFAIGINRRQHQFKNTECGMFAINFLATCLDNPTLSFAEIMDRPIDDEVVNGLRNTFYSPNVLARGQELKGT